MSTPECEGLAPYLREKLAQDRAHTWRDAPYIHEQVRAELRAAEAAARPPMYPPPYRTWGGYADMTNVYHTMQTQLLQMQMQNVQQQMTENMLNARQNGRRTQ